MQSKITEWAIVHAKYDISRTYMSDNYILCQALAVQQPHKQLTSLLCAYLVAYLPFENQYESIFLLARSLLSEDVLFVLLQM